MTTAPPPAADSSPSSALIDAELDRLAGSDTFARSARAVRLLRHLVRAVQAGDLAGLREMALGVHFFGRDPARFDPRADSIVRVEAGRLRRKLQRYYADEGLDARLEFRLVPRSFRVEVLRRTVAAPGLRPRASLLCFDCHAGTPADAALAALVGSELNALLARLNGLRIVAGGPRPDRVKIAARAFDCAWVLLADVLPAADGMACRLRLLRADDEALVWATQRLLPAADPAAALLEPARRIIAELRREAESRRLQRIGPAARLPLPRARHAAARDRLALARSAMAQATVDGYHQAERLAREAAALAPDDADAMALCAEALVAQAGLTAVPSRPALDSARAAAEAALALDAEHAGAHWVLAHIRMHVDRDWPRAEARLLAALRAAPGHAASHARYGWALMMNRRFAEARAAYAEARDLDPLSLLYRAHEALVSLYERRYGEAAARLEDVLAVRPDHLVARSLRAALHLYAGEAAAGAEAYRRVLQEWPRLSIGRCGLAQAAALQGDAASARQQLQQLLAQAAAGWVSPYQIAMVHARLGETDAALAWLERAAREADFNFICAAVDPCFDAVRATPAGRALLRRYGFAHLAASF